MTEADFIAALREFWIEQGVVLTTGGSDPVVAQQWWEDDEGEPTPAAPYHRCTIRTAANVPMTIGRAREENRGLVTVQVFAPHSSGPGPVERLASEVSARWRTFRHSRIKLSPPQVVGLSRLGAFNRQLVTVGWRADLRPAQQ